MKFGRKARDTEAEAIAEDDADLVEEAELPEASDDGDDADDDVVDPDGFDPRADGPFDYDEVDLEGDTERLAANGMRRVAFGPLLVTRPDDLLVQLQADPQTNQVYTVLAHREGSGLELALFAAPRSGGLAAELREEIVEEAIEAGGSAEVADGPFGPEVRRVLSIDGPEGEQRFHVSRIWLVEGPRWLLRGVLMGQAALTRGEDAPSDFFVEFFRNLVVRRDDEPRSPGELIHLALPEGVTRG